MMTGAWLGIVVASAAAASTGTIFKPGDWYKGLRKPGFTPPDIAFPIVWTAIYLLSAWAAIRIAAQAEAGPALALWAAQIALNTLWTPVFFGARKMAAAMAVIVALWLTVAATTVAFWRLDALAGSMLVPYLGWLCIAAALNWRLWRDNPGGVAG